VRQGPGGFGNYRCVSGVRFGLAGVQVSDAPHGQTGQVADHDALCLGHGDRQGADGGGLVDDQQDPSLACYGRDDGAQLGLVLGQCPVEDLLALAVDGDRVVIALADVNTDEDVDEFMVFDQRKPPRICVRQICVGMSCGGKVRHPRYG